ncbi:GAP family protein [Streptomyces sp. NPDC002758]
MLVSAQGVWKGLTFILGWLACLVAVLAIVLALTGGHPSAPKSAPSTAVLAAELLIGVSLVFYGAHRRRRTTPARTSASSSSDLASRTDRSPVWAAAGLAVLLQPWGLVAAGATTVVEADLSHSSSWLALFSFCVLATASLLAAEVYVVFAPTAARPAC